MTDYLDTVLSRFREQGYDITESVTEWPAFECVARKVDFKWTWLAFVEFMFLFKECNFTELSLFEEFCEDCYQYATKNGTKSVDNWLSRLLSAIAFFGRTAPLPVVLWTFPVAIVKEVPNDIVEKLKTESPRQKWASPRFPVIFHPDTNTLHYFRKTPFLGNVVVKEARKMAKKLLSP